MTAPELHPLSQLPREASEPVRKIYAVDDMPRFLESQAYSDIETLIARLRVASTQNVADTASQPVTLLLDFLSQARAWIAESNTSGTAQKQRDAFQTWLDKVDENTAILHHDLIDPSRAAALPEMRFHLLSSFGSPQRLDYGTGHELSFLAYLLILRLAGVLTPEDEPAIAKKLFAGYLDLVKQLQRAFGLAPAGKMGIWGVDAHGHLVYHWGASQSRIHPSKRPASLLSPPKTSPTGVSYLFLTTLLHLNGDVPAGPQEDDDSLLRLYRHEVLDRLPVVQHFRFGPFLRWMRTGTEEALRSSGDGLDEAERAALDDTLDQRERGEGTVAPWALPALSGELPPDQALARLPTPVSPKASRPPSLHADESSAPASPVALAADLPKPASPPSPVPTPYSSGHSGLGPRRTSRLSVSESFEEALGGKEGRE